MRWNPSKEQHYYQILQVLEAWMPKKQLEAWVTEAVETFKRRDRIQYILMQVRFKAVLKLLAKLPRDVQNKDVKKLQAIYWKYLDTYSQPGVPLFILPDEVTPPKFPNRLSDDQERALWGKLQSDYEELEHLMNTMDIHQYQTALDIIWAHQPINTSPDADSLLITQLFAAIEQDKEEMQDEFILQEDREFYGGKLFVKCDDRFAWYALVTPEQRKKEAELMNHCAATHHGILLSLREFVPHRGLQPHLTFEYIPNTKNDHSGAASQVAKGLKKSVGILGETKGRGNIKPAPHYQDQIMCLLEAPNILAVVGGTYQSQNNFRLDDLSPGNVKKLKNLKPELFNSELLLKTRVNALSKWLKTYFPNHKVQNGQVISHTFECVEDAFNYVATNRLLSDCTYSSGKLDEQFARLNEVLENPDKLGFWSEVSTDSILSRMLSELQTPKRKAENAQFLLMLDTAAKKLQLNSEEILSTVQDEDFDSLPDGILEPLQDAANASDQAGWESGTIFSIYKYLKEVIPLHTKNKIITKSGVITTVQQLFEEFLGIGQEDESVDYEECLRVRRLLHYASEAQDFDDDISVETFLDRLHSEL